MSAHLGISGEQTEIITFLFVFWIRGSVTFVTFITTEGSTEPDGNLSVIKADLFDAKLHFHWTAVQAVSYSFNVVSFRVRLCRVRLSEKDF